MSLSFLFTQSSKASFNGIIEIPLDASISEKYSNAADVTSFPVEDGSEITDHVIVKPIELTIEGFITDTPVTFLTGIRDALSDVSGSGSVSKTALENLELLFNNKEPFTVVTGLKTYENMILRKLDVPRDKDTGFTLRFTAELVEVKFASFKETKVDKSKLSTTQNANEQAQAKADVGKQSTGVPTAGEAAKTSTLFDLGNSLGFL